MTANLNGQGIDSENEQQPQPQVQIIKIEDSNEECNDMNKQIVQQWLTDIGLGKSGILEILIDNAFDNMDLIQTMTESDMKAMDIIKVGWRRSLLNGIDALKK